jgi:hypothetical protein
MSFFIRVWTKGGEIPFINSREDEITFDVTDIVGSVVIDAEVEGSYLYASEIRELLSITGNVISITGREILSQSVSFR